LLESGLWVSLASTKNKEASPTAFLHEKLTSKIDKLLANLTKHKGTCWTCGKEGHKSHDCPTKKSKDSPETSKKKNKDDKKKSTSKATQPEWQRTAPVGSESEASVKNRKTWMWCDTCKNWSMTHGTSTHKGPNASNARNKASRTTEKKKENQGNLAEIVLDCDTNNLVMGAWCGFTNEFTNTTFIPTLSPTPECADTATKMNATLNGWMTVVSHLSKKKNNATRCGTCHSLSLHTLSTIDSTCHWCNPETITTQILHDMDNFTYEDRYYTNPGTQKPMGVTASVRKGQLIGQDDYATKIMSSAAPPPIKI
jgi:Zinc knuckle